MCESKGKNTVEERLAVLEAKQLILLQTASCLISDQTKLQQEMEDAHKAFSSFMLKVCGEIPSMRAGMEKYIETRAEHVGQADQMKKLFGDLIERSKD